MMFLGGSLRSILRRMCHLLALHRLRKSTGLNGASWQVGILAISGRSPLYCVHRRSLALMGDGSLPGTRVWQRMDASRC
ncbi:hypothetical protein BJX76DRAFT_341616 [Aspergillus varians]